jgi:putative membrane protein
MTVANIAVLVVGCIHLVIAAAEMLLWKRKSVYGRLERLRLSEDEAAKVGPIVANAGLYNSFLGVGLVWSASNHAGLLPVKLYLLCCVAVAGVFGAFTLKWSTLLIQTVPSLVAIWLLISMSAK